MNSFKKRWRAIFFSVLGFSVPIAYSLIAIHSLIYEIDTICPAPTDEVYPEYAIEGHGYTVAILGHLAGLKPETARRFAYFAQAPDAFKYQYTAYPAPQLMYPRHPIRAARLLKVLHSLHGGGEQEIVQWQKVLLEKLKRVFQEKQWHRSGEISEDSHNNQIDWRVGLLLHAYADSYSHTRVNRKDGVEAYGWVIGHDLWHQNERADEITAHPWKYERYVQDIFEVFDSGGSRREELEDFLSRLRKSGGPGIPKEEDVARFLASEYDATRNRVTHEDCKKWEDELVPADVDTFLREIESSFMTSGDAS